MSINISSLVTEQRNPNTMNIDSVSTTELVHMINEEDKKVPLAVEKEADHIAQAIDIITSQLEMGGRLFYCGAGTSGRLGILDASECPPTYGVSPELVTALIAGGEPALLKAVEGAEDSKELCKADLIAASFSHKDVLVSIAASGRTPYAIGGMEYAHEMGAQVISLTCNPNSEMASIADIAISPVVGPEAVTGSTRMKAGTAQKLVLNMLTTGTMIKLGKVYQNLMVDVQPSNQKLMERAKSIVMEAAGCSREEAETALIQAENHPKTAILMLLLSIPASQAKRLLEESKGHIQAAVKRQKSFQ